MYIDTHAHLDGEEFRDDLADVVKRIREAGALQVYVPGINLSSLQTVDDVCRRYPGFLYPMIGLHPEDVKDDYSSILDIMEQRLKENIASGAEASSGMRYIAIGEVGLDYYWSREFEKEQLEAFERQVAWAAEYQLPLMIHCRKAQNEMVAIIRRYESRLTRGGVFHCFTGNVNEALQLLAFDRFVLGIGGVLTFKKSHLPDTLSSVVPIDRIVVETDSPYMAPVPMRGKRNDSSYIPYIIDRLADVYGVSSEDVARTTTETARKIFNV